MKYKVSTTKPIGDGQYDSQTLWSKYMPEVHPNDRLSVEVIHSKHGRKAIFTYRRAD